MAFGDFESICQQAALPLCANVGSITTITGSMGIEADCYARNIELANTIIFQGAASFMHISALTMTVIMILHVRSKFTAVGTSPWLPLEIQVWGMLVLIYYKQAAKKLPPSSTSTCYYRSLRSFLMQA